MLNVHWRYLSWLQANTPEIRKIMGHPFVFFLHLPTTTSPRPSQTSYQGHCWCGSPLSFSLVCHCRSLQILCTYNQYIHTSPACSPVSTTPLPINFVHRFTHLAHLSSRTCFFTPFGPELGVIAENATPTRAEHLASRRPTSYPPLAPLLINAAVSAIRSSQGSFSWWHHICPHRPPLTLVAVVVGAFESFKSTS